MPRAETICSILRVISTLAVYITQRDQEIKADRNKRVINGQVGQSLLKNDAKVATMANLIPSRMFQ